jgi:hypothetical protein
LKYIASDNQSAGEGERPEMTARIKRVIQRRISEIAIAAAENIRGLHAFLQFLENATSRSQMLS